MPSIELRESICGISLKTGCFIAAAVYIIFGIVFLVAEFVEPMNVGNNKDVSDAAHYLAIIGNTIAIVLGVFLILGAATETKVLLLVCLILWIIHILMWFVIALLITLHMRFFPAIYVFVGFVAIFILFLYLGILMYSYYKTL